MEHDCAHCAHADTVTGRHILVCEWQQAEVVPAGSCEMWIGGEDDDGARGPAKTRKRRF